MRIVFFTGAGVSAESGISTFRDSNGLWENHKIEEVCNAHTWKQNRELVFKFYNERRIQLNKVEPNLIHKKIAEIQNKYENVEIITQNVDDLFERAGCKDVIHVHGELTKMQCTACSHIWDIGYKEIDPDTVRCPKCNSNKGVKPNIVFFYENAPKYMDMKRAFRKLESGDLLIVLGTMGNVVNIHSELSFTPASTILNNLEKSPYIDDSRIDYVFYKKGTEAILDIEKIIEDKYLNSIW